MIITDAFRRQTPSEMGADPGSPKLMGINATYAVTIIIEQPSARAMQIRESAQKSFRTSAKERGGERRLGEGGLERSTGPAGRRRGGGEDDAEVGEETCSAASRESGGG